MEHIASVTIAAIRNTGRPMATLSIDEGKELLSLCGAGKLYEIEAWIDAGKSLHVPEEPRKTPLRVAIDLGFYSLVQLLATHEDSATIMNDALGAVVDLRSLELVQLLLKHGAEIRGVPLISVLRSWDPALMQLFLDGGADVVTEFPFTMAFSEKIRTALNRFVAFKRSHPELDLLISRNEQRRRAALALVAPRGLLSRYNREDLYEKVWSQPMRILAKEYGISDVGLAKVCRKLEVPVPGRGYWAKKAAGRVVPKKPILRPLGST
jgi:hypothetical protein